MSVPSSAISNIVEYLKKGEDVVSLDLPLSDGLSSGDWSSNSNELLDDFFSADGGLLDMQSSHMDSLDILDFGEQACTTARSLAGSDSGLSMDHDIDLVDQQFSPLMMHSSDDDLLNSSLTSVDKHMSIDSVSTSSPESSPSPGQSSPSISDVGSPAECYEDKIDLGSCQNKISRDSRQPAQTFQNISNLKRKSSTPPPAAVVYPTKIQHKQFVNKRDSPPPIKNITLPRNDKQRIILSNCSNGSLSNIQIVNSQSQPCDSPLLNKKIIRVAPVAGNPRSILLPVSYKDIKEIRSIKIINATDLKSPANIQIAAANFLQKTKQAMDNNRKKNNIVYAAFDSDEQQYVMEDSMSDRGSGHSDDDDDDRMGDDDIQINHKNGHFPRLELTSEERRLLVKEGISLPSSYPLTRLEERELKRIRRKIRNKISAQDSRRRKKEYVDGLEDRVKQCTDENQSLMRKIKALQSQNQSLSSQLKKFQSIITKGPGHKSTQPATCLIVLLLSVALVMAPSLRTGNSPSQNRSGNSLSTPHTALLNSIRRALLSAHTSTPPVTSGVVSMEESADEIINVEEMLPYGQPLTDHNYPLLECPIPTPGGRFTKPGYMDIPIDEGGSSPMRNILPSPKQYPVKLEKLEYDSEYDGNDLFLSHTEEAEEIVIDSKDFKDEGIKLYDMAMEKIEILEDRSAFAHISGKLNELLDLSPPMVKIDSARLLRETNNKNFTNFRNNGMTNMELE